MPSGMRAGDPTARSNALAHAVPLVRITQHDDQSVEATAIVFRTLGNAIRLRLIATLLEKGPMTRTQLAQTTQISRALLMHHVVALEQDSFLDVKYLDREAVYTVTPGLLPTLETLCAH